MEQLQGSPEMKYARSRLGNLLAGIRENASGVEAEGDVGYGELEEEYAGEDSPRKTVGPGRGRRGRKERKVLFELRGKPFELRDNEREESLFGLCRTWVQGREFYPSTTGIEDQLPGIPPAPSEDPSEESVEALAMKEVHALPKPNASEPMVVRGQPGPSDVPLEGVETESRAELLGAYLPHWKAVKRNWQKEGALRERRYARSLALLRTIYNLNAQSAIVT